MIGWVIAIGTVFAFLALRYFWEDIASWLNNTAANAVERVLGYDARRAMQRAVCRVSRVVDRLKNRAVVYSKRNVWDTHYDKVTLEASVPVYEIDDDVLQEIKEQGELVQDFQFRG